MDILKNNHDFSKEIGEFRFGDIGQDGYGNNFPLCFTSMPNNPIMSKQVYYPAHTVNSVPGYKWEQEYWAVIVVAEGTPELAQARIYQLGHLAQWVLSQNVQLRDKDGTDPLCTNSSCMLQRRMESLKGDLVESMTVRVRPTNFTYSFD